MAIAYVPSTGLPTKGVIPEPGSGVRLQSSTCTPTDPKLWHRNEEGGRLGFAHGFDQEVRIELIGELYDTEGTFPLLKFGEAITLANEALGRYADNAPTGAVADSTYNGVGNLLDPATTKMSFYFDGPVSYGSTRNNWLSFRCTMLAVPLMTEAVT